MSETTKIIIAIISGLLGFSILFSLFKFIIIDYFKTIKKNKERIEEIEKELIRRDPDHDEKKSRDESRD